MIGVSLAMASAAILAPSNIFFVGSILTGGEAPAAYSVIIPFIAYPLLLTSFRICIIKVTVTIPRQTYVYAPLALAFALTIVHILLYDFTKETIIYTNLDRLSFALYTIIRLLEMIAVLYILSFAMLISVCEHTNTTLESDVSKIATYSQFCLAYLVAAILVIIVSYFHDWNRVTRFFLGGILRKNSIYFLVIPVFFYIATSVNFLILATRPFRSRFHSILATKLASTPLAETDSTTQYP